MTDLNTMWTRLEAHQSIADQRGYGREWRRMCEERTPESAADAGEEAWSAEAESAEAAAKAAWAAEAGIRAKAGAAWATVAIIYIAEAEEVKP